MRRRIAVILCLLVVLCCRMAGCARAETVVGDVDSRLNAGRIEYGGQRYLPLKRLTTVLLIGTDRRDSEAAEAAARSGGQADFLVLVVIDENADVVTPIQINRDTMMDIRTFSQFGQEMGLWRAQICLAHSFGDGREKSCELTAGAVSRLLKDVPVDHYISMSLDGIAALNDALGGVTVTLEEDFSAYDPAMTPGITLTLQGMQAEYYTRMRYDVGDQSNVARLARQRNYIEQATALFEAKARENASFAEEMYHALDEYIVTDMSQGRLINLADSIAHCEVRTMREIAGDSCLGESGYMEFTPDEEALWRMVLETFYRAEAE